ISAQRICRVKIQGSDELITARFGQNWEQTPQWLKPGNAVRIVHRGGIRGYIEVVGHGQSIPMAVPGGSVTPPSVTPSDAIISGLQIISTTPASMAVFVQDGIFRISNVVYSLAGVGVLMEAGSLLLMGTNVSMGTGYASIIQIAAAPAAGQFRIDLIVIGADSVVDYVQGAAATTPIQPDTPSGHLLLGTILVPGGVTAIPQNYINKAFTTPIPTSLTMVVDPAKLEWYTADPTGEGVSDNDCCITVTILDQYGNGYLESGAGQYIRLGLCVGEGYLYSWEEGWLYSKSETGTEPTDYIGRHQNWSGASSTLKFHIVPTLFAVIQAELVLWGATLKAITYLMDSGAYE
ncbi:MAG: hypothetical protein PHI16_06405, partial [Methanocellales archaeon]|nr:hypothetical protein [Methanocellales archaeon]